MNRMFTADHLAQTVNQWCHQHRIAPATGQAGERITVRNIRYYRSLGLLDPPLVGGGQGFGEKHRLQLQAIRLLQARGLPLNRIQELLFGRTLRELQEIEERGLEELEEATTAVFRPSADESWRMTPLNEEFLIISRHGRGFSPRVRTQLLQVLEAGTEEHVRRGNGERINR